MYELKGEYLGILLGENGDPYFAQKIKVVMRSTLQGAFRLPKNDIHTSYILEFGMSAIIGTFTHWYHNKKDIPSKEIVRMIRSMLTAGVAQEIQKYSIQAFNLSG